MNKALLELWNGLGRHNSRKLFVLIAFLYVLVTQPIPLATQIVAGAVVSVYLISQAIIDLYRPEQPDEPEQTE